MARKVSVGRSIPRLILHAILIAICAAWLIPSLGLFISSFRTHNLISTSGWWTALLPPFKFTLSNYHYVLTRGHMGISFVNSLIIAIPSTIMPTLIAAFAAYAFAWMRFPFKEGLFLVIIGLLVVPLQLTLIPVLRLFNTLGLTGSFVAIWLAHTGYGLPFAIYLLRNFMQDLPGSVLESAYLDGASHPQIFFKLIMPMSVPAIASLAIFQFMWVWNDLLIALIYLGGTESVAPMTVTMSNMVNSYGGGWEYLTAAAFISMVLPMLVFFTLQKYFVRGILAGSVKG